MRFIKYILIALLLGCGSNIERKSEQQESKSIVENGFYEEKVKEKSPSLTLNASGNATVTLGNEAIISTRQTSKEKAITSNTVWDLSIKDAYEKYQVWTYAIMGIGFLIIVLAMKLFKGTMFGQSVAGGLRVFNSAVGLVDDALTTLTPKSDEFEAMRNLRDQLTKKQSSLKAKQKPKGY